MPSSGYASIKEEYIIPKVPKILVVEPEKISRESESEPATKKIKRDEDVLNASQNESTANNKDGSNNGSTGPKLSKRAEKKKFKGMNKAKDRPKPMKFENEKKLCPHYHDGPTDAICPRLPDCVYLHDIKAYLDSNLNSIDGNCYLYETYGKCVRGLTCLFYKSHTDSTGRNIVNEKLWSRMEPEYKTLHSPILSNELKISLRKRVVDFKCVDKICGSIGDSSNRTLGPFTDEDSVIPRSSEIKKIDWKDKLYLAPLTTVGNLPFRRLCVDFGADITCSEMSLATSLLQGQAHEFALHRRHPCEKIWGVQLCANHGSLAAKAAHALALAGVDYDFVDLNCGCPLEPIYLQGAGSGLMCREKKFCSTVKIMNTYMNSIQKKPFTVKIRTGIKNNVNTAHKLIPFFRDTGVGLVTLHGRSKEQRYLKTANWDYIGECAKLMEPLPLFGNGDILSYEDYNTKRSLSNVSGVMIGRGALVKPWIFQEIKEQKNIDMSSSQRLELIQRYCNYGLDHWGSDSQGVATTRRFLLEWLSFYYRYIPFALLENPPQILNERPPPYRGRDEMETLLASNNARDWVKISEMFLGPVPDNFAFLPKHKANAWVD